LLTFFYDAGGEGAWMFWCRDYGCGAGGQVAYNKIHCVSKGGRLAFGKRS
jgi:hypothetical protein